MVLGLTIGIATLALAAGIFGGLAYGYRNARDTAQEQIKYLREQIAKLMPPIGPGGPVTQRGGVHVVDTGR